MRTSITLLALLFLLNFTSASAQTEIRLTTDSASSNTSYNSQRCIAATGDTIHAVWSDYRGLRAEVYYTKSSDGGITWNPEMPLTADNNFKSFLPTIGVSGTDVYVFWVDSVNGGYEVYYSKSSNAGNTWGPETRLTYSPSSATIPSVYVSGQNIYVTWHDNRDGNDEIYFKKSTDGALTWSNDTRLTNALMSSQQSSITGHNNFLHVTWLDSRDGNPEIYYKRSIDGGLSWEPDFRMTNDSIYCLYPSMSCSDSIVHLVWEDFRFGSRSKLFYRRSTDNGNTWSADSNIVNGSSWSSAPVIYSLDNLVYLTWFDFRDFDQEIYFKTSGNYGQSWGTDIRLTCSTGISRFPFITASTQNVWHVLWEDWRDGNLEIYYKQAIAACNPTSINDQLLNNIDANFIAFPNPVTDRLTITLKDANKNVSLGIVDISGRVINLPVIINSSGIELNTATLANGIYFLRIQSEKLTEILKLVVEK
jgi:hypothetical protein